MRIAHSAHIPGKPDEVFSWIDDPEKAMQWQKGVESSEIIKETQERIGTTFLEVMEEGGKSLEMHGVITGYARGEMISFHLESRVHAVDVRYTVRGEDGNSAVSMESDIRWKFPMNIMSLVVGRKMRAKIAEQLEEEFAELKRLCSGRPAI